MRSYVWKKNCWISGRQCKPWSDAPTLFSQVCLSQYTGIWGIFLIEHHIKSTDRGHPDRKASVHRTSLISSKTCLYNFDPLKPHFYRVKLGFTGVYIIFLFSAQKHRLWVLVRIASAGRFQRVPTVYVLSRNVKNIRIFNEFLWQWIYLNRRVFVKLCSLWNCSCLLVE